MPNRVNNFKAEDIVDAMYMMHSNITKTCHAKRCQIDLSNANMNKYAYIKVKYLHLSGSIINMVNFAINMKKIIFH